MANLLLTCGTSLRIFYAIALGLDGIIYWFVDVIYSLFIVVSNTQLFSATTFESFSTRIYSIIGVVMLFVAAVQLLKGIIDPDKMSSGDSSTGTLVKNVLITLILIVVLPTGFKYLYKIQNLVVKENIIANIIVGGYTSGKEANNIIANTGKDMAFRTFTAFINPAGYTGNNDIACSQDGSLTFCTIYRVISNYGSDNYGKIGLFNVENVRAEIDNEKVEYRWGVSGIAGALIAWMLLSFTIDVAVRVAKLAYYQLIAPVPIVLRIIPKQQSVFDNWLKGLFSTYLGLFIRLIVIFFGLYLINLIPGVWNNIAASGGELYQREIVNTFAKIALIFGVLIFMKEAPKLISQMFGVSDGDLSLGIGKKLAGAAVVGGIGGKAIKSATGRVTGTIGGMSQGMDLKSAWMNQGKAGAKAGGWQFGAGRTNAYQVMSGTTDKNRRETEAKARARAAQEASFARKDASALQKIFGGASAYDSFRNKVASKVGYSDFTAEEQAEYTALRSANPTKAAAYFNTTKATHTEVLMEEYAIKASSGRQADIDDLTAQGFNGQEISKLEQASAVYAAKAKRQEGFEKKKAQSDFAKIIAEAQKNTASGGSTPSATPPPSGGSASSGGAKK